LGLNKKYAFYALGVGWIISFFTFGFEYFISACYRTVLSSSTIKSYFSSVQMGWKINAGIYSDVRLRSFRNIEINWNWPVCSLKANQ
jgi:hypothetical protein